MHAVEAECYLLHTLRRPSDASEQIDGGRPSDGASERQRLVPIQDQHPAAYRPRIMCKQKMSNPKQPYDTLLSHAKIGDGSRRVTEATARGKLTELLRTWGAKKGALNRHLCRGLSRVLPRVILPCELGWMDSK